MQLATSDFFTYVKPCNPSLLWHLVNTMRGQDVQSGYSLPTEPKGLATHKKRTIHCIGKLHLPVTEVRLLQ